MIHYATLHTIALQCTTLDLCQQTNVNIVNIFPLFVDTVREREVAEMLPATRDVQGAGFGLARLHSLYEVDTDKFFDDGVVSTNFNLKDVKSEPSVMKLTSETLGILSLFRGAKKLWQKGD